MNARGPAALALLLLACAGAWGGTSPGAPAIAASGKSGEHSGSPSESTSTPSCPSPNPPSELTLVGGTPQTAVLGAAFAGTLQVALANSDGCPVTGTAGVAVRFSAPSAGASGTFSASDSSTVTVGADASGNVTAPTFTANYTPGSYAVTASSQYGVVSFGLTNAAAPGTWCPTLGKLVSNSERAPVKLIAGVGSTQSTRVGAAFSIRLAVTVTDAQGNPEPGALVTFSAPARGASGRFAYRSSAARSKASPGHRARAIRHRPHVSLRRRIGVRADACGIAVAPPFIAGRAQGGYVVKATAGSAVPAAFALVNEAR